MIRCDLSRHGPGYTYAHWSPNREKGTLRQWWIQGDMENALLSPAFPSLGFVNLFLVFGTKKIFV